MIRIRGIVIVERVRDPMIAVGGSDARSTRTYAGWHFKKVKFVALRLGERATAARDFLESQSTRTGTTSPTGAVDKEP